VTALLDEDRRKASPPLAGKGTLTWRPCGEDLSIWRMVCIRPDQELFATIDLARAELLSFEVEWDEAEGHRSFVTWSVRSGFSAGGTDSVNSIDESEAESTGGSPKILGMALVIVEDAGIVSPVATWILDRLSAALARR